MKRKIISQSRRDFTAIYECEHCGHEHRGGGYDDTNFHQNVIPDMECPECKKKADASYRPLATKYPTGISFPTHLTDARLKSKPHNQPR